MPTRCSVDEFTERYLRIADDYEREVYEETKKGIDKTAKKMKDVIRDSTEFQDRTGKYRKAFALRKQEDRTWKRYSKTWYVKAPHYRLTHLLEKGHLTRSGGRTRAFPHIEKGEQYAEENLIQNIEEEIERAT